MFIYKITNLINGKIYIGQTTRNVEERWKAHCRSKGNYSTINKAIIKYKKENFKLEIIYTTNCLKDLNKKEKYYIKFYNSLAPNGYNLETGGKNKKASNFLKQKLSTAKLGKKYGKRSPQSGNNISQAKCGKKFKVTTAKGDFIGIWLNKSECARQLGLRVEKISQCCQGTRKTHKGYSFSYVEE